MLWDIFCKVIDNHGDIGVCWRLARGLAGRGHQIRLWVDDASALRWMAPEGDPAVQVLQWDQQRTASPGEVVIEAFGCEITDAFQAAIKSCSKRVQPPWINLEYLTAESFAERNHELPSPILSGPAAGLTKHFFYPGFTTRSGGLLHEPDLMQRRSVFVRPTSEVRRISLFCYEPAALRQLLRVLGEGPRHTELLVTAGRATAATKAALTQSPEVLRGNALSITWLPLMTQEDFDRLLWSCDLNLVRGEDSLVRALWAGQPFIWQLYPQDDDAHHAKLAAFLDWLDAPASLREAHFAWNGITDDLPPIDLDLWSECVNAARARLLPQDDLVTQLLRFVEARIANP
jgi:uncharacterized repeat protein (TIGR03837 family)